MTPVLPPAIGRSTAFAHNFNTRHPKHGYMRPILSEPSLDDWLVAIRVVQSISTIISNIGLLFAIKYPVNRTDRPRYHPLDPKHGENSNARCTSTFVRQNSFMVQTLRDATGSFSRSSISTKPFTKAGRSRSCRHGYWGTASVTRDAAFDTPQVRVSPTFLDVLVVNHTLSGEGDYRCTFGTNSVSGIL